MQQNKSIEDQEQMLHDWRREDYRAAAQMLWNFETVLTEEFWSQFPDYVRSSVSPEFRQFAVNGFARYGDFEKRMSDPKRASKLKLLLHILAEDSDVSVDGDSEDGRATGWQRQTAVPQKAEVAKNTGPVVENVSRKAVLTTERSRSRPPEQTTARKRSLVLGGSVVFVAVAGLCLCKLMRLYAQK